MTSYPLISIISATFNSAKTLELMLKSVKAQSYPQDKIEIMIMDGGSSDDTLKLAKKYGCRVIHNPKTEPVNAKFLGYHQAKGKYAIYLDSDEVLESKDSIKDKYVACRDNPAVKAVVSTGYKGPLGYPFINSYVNEFGDPFSFFIYRLSKDARFFVSTMKAKYRVIKETNSYVLFDFSNVNTLPIIELVAQSAMVDLEYLKKTFPHIAKDSTLIPHFFYLLVTKGAQIAVTKHDAIIHYSAETITKYFRKIEWRVKNNIYHLSDMAGAAFTGREKLQPSPQLYKKYLFIPYALFPIFSLIDALYLVVSRKNLGYFWHVPLCFYTGALISYHYTLKMMGQSPALRSYDGSKEVKQ